MRTLAVVCNFVLLASTLIVPTVHATWVEDGLPVATTPGGAVDPHIASDGAGGAYVVWWDDRNSSTDIYAQRVDADGNPVWAVNGVPVCNASGDQSASKIAADGAGGAYIVWMDARAGTYDIYAQRVSPDGTMLWAPNGVAICSATGDQQYPEVDFDGFALLVAWLDTRNDIGDVYAQRVDGSGNALWAANGLAVSTASNEQYLARIISDGAAGAIVAWTDYRNGDADVYAQAINFFGSPAWTPNGVAVAALGGGTNEFLAGLVPDGLGGALITHTNSSSVDIRVHRLDAAGVEQWGSTGASILAGSALSGNVLSISDGSGGAIVTWALQNSISSYDVHFQRLIEPGGAIWPSTLGSVVTTWDQITLDTVSDGEGGVILVMSDKRDFPSNNGSDLYVQHIDPSGHEVWAPTGVPVTHLPGYRVNASAVPTADGAFLVAWQDSRNGVITTIYAQRVEPRYGWWGRPEPAIVSVADVPDDQGGNVVLGWTASERDKLAYQQITHYSEWRALDTLPATPTASPTALSSHGSETAGNEHWLARAVADRYGASTNLVTLADVGPDFDGPAVRAETSNGVIYLWEFVDTQDAIFSPGYSDVVATRQDSVGGDPALHYFQVVAHTADPQIFFPSAPDSGYSVDNVAPAAPIALTAARAGGSNVDLDWHAGSSKSPDFKEYRIYRGDESGFPIATQYLLGSSTDTMTVDGGAIAWTAWYYRVVSVDVHGNESTPSNEAMVDATVTGVGTHAPALSHLQVLDNAPNPFGESTTFEFGMPAPGHVSITVYDVAGRLVYSRDAGEMGAGWHRRVFTGVNSEGHRLASGVYFYRINANGEVATRKIVIQR